MLTKEGLLHRQQIYFQGLAYVGPFYVILFNGSPDADSTLATIAELTGNNYSRQAVNRDATLNGFSTLAIDGDGAATATGKTVTFRASGGDWSAASYKGLATTASGTTGKLIAYEAFDSPVTLRAGASLDVTPSDSFENPA